MITIDFDLLKFIVMAEPKKTRKKMDPDVSVHLRYLYQDKGCKLSELCKRYPEYPRSTIHRHMKLPIKMERGDKRKLNKGRPSLLTSRDRRNIKTAIKKLRSSQGPSFNSKRIAVEAGVNHVCDRTVRRYLKSENYSYCHLRKKGLLSENDRKVRVEFAESVKKVKGDLWRQGISFYLDGVSFAHKYNPRDTAKTSGSMGWRLPNEGLKVTAKGKKEGVGSRRMANFIVAIAYKKGVVACEQYSGRINGQVFADMIEKNFSTWFECSANPSGRRFLQDGDPSQNSAVAKKAWKNLNCVKQPIPPRSPDLNPIENMFNCIREEARIEAVKKNISFETFDDFSARVKRTMLNYSKDKIDKTIDSMDKRINMVIESEGYRTKY